MTNPLSVTALAGDAPRQLPQRGSQENGQKNEPPGPYGPGVSHHVCGTYSVDSAVVVPMRSRM